MNTMNLQLLPIDQVELDISNPRIAKSLEMYGDNITSEDIALALSGGSGDGSTSYYGLFESIKVNKEQYEAKNLVGINGQIPVNDKLISIVRPQIRVVDNRLMYSLPEGYLKVGDYGIKVSVIAKEETNTLGR